MGYNMSLGNDWRLRGQEEYLQNQVFQYIRFTGLPGKSLHAHCEFCWHKFMVNPDGVNDCSRQGYCGADGKYWVCEECLEDFREKLHWRLMEEEKYGSGDADTD